MGSNQVNPDVVLFLHGFWGQSSDWNFLKPNGFLKTIFAVPYMEIPQLGPENFISDWGRNFLAWKNELYGPKKITAVGYSQGGRLLLQAFAAAPEEFEKLVLISVHPGLTDFKEKENRLAQDRKWAHKFRIEDWHQLQSEWNQQGVFQEKPSPIKLEKDYSREGLALCFENWSLAHQQNFRELIDQNFKKIHLILGEEDSKYIQLYKSFLSDPAHLKIAKGAAHRVPFDQPSIVVEILNSII